MLSINSSIQIPLKELEFSFARSSGPGGQNVNKVNSKATLRWNVTQSEALPPAVRERLISACRSRMTIEGDLLLHSQRYRDQGRNVTDCMEKLQALVLAAVEIPAERKATKPTRS